MGALGVPDMNPVWATRSVCWGRMGVSQEGLEGFLFPIGRLES